MRSTIIGCIFTIAALFATPIMAQTCGGTYKVQRGDSLSLIADRLYKNAGMWTAIHSNNLALIGDNPNTLQAGKKLNLRCIDGRPLGLEGGRDAAQIVAQAEPLVITPGTAATRRKINVLTGSDFAPFTDKDLPNGGMLTEVVQAAMEAAAPDQGFAIHWVDDWAAHHEPLLSNALLDIGFPWFQPDCDADPTTYRCANLKFSESMFEVLILLFVDNSRPLAFNTDADLKGKTLCRPLGYSTYIFDQDGRNWLAEGHINLEIANTIADCFDLLTEAKVDAVVMNEFTGRKKVRELGLQDRVSVGQGQPISIDGNHMVVHVSHPDGDALLAVFEDGLHRIREDGSYQRIIEEHMTRIWAEF